MGPGFGPGLDNIKPVTISQGGSKCLKSGYVTRKLENPQNSQNAKDLSCFRNVLERILGR